MLPPEKLEIVKSFNCLRFQAPSLHSFCFQSAPLSEIPKFRQGKRGVAKILPVLVAFVKGFLS